MTKFWDDLLVTYRERNEIVLLPIHCKDYYGGFGEYVFTTPGIRDWLRQNDKPRNPPSPNRIWDDQQETIYFAFKDQKFDFRGHDGQEQAEPGFFVCVYSNNDELRSKVMQAVYPVISKLKSCKGVLTHYQGENNKNDTVCYWRSWEIELTPENVGAIIEAVAATVTKAICKIVI